MAVKQIFALTNPYKQNGEEGICTAASLAWCKCCLKLGRGLTSANELRPDARALNAQMAVLRRFDNNPEAQTEMAGLKWVKEFTAHSIDDVIREMKASPSHIGIFWNTVHTMGYSYSHNDKEFFDQNNGLYRAKTSKEIRGLFRSLGYGNPAWGPVQGGRIVSLT